VIAPPPVAAPARWRGGMPPWVRIADVIVAVLTLASLSALLTGSSDQTAHSGAEVIDFAAARQVRASPSSTMTAPFDNSDSSAW